ncbi:sensor histidine kinase [Paenibacillus sp. PDC88]|uniref:cache domain-containing sensor histidine kinase n=1 Tax=Paenibacillus sp. PDC88 TaxID=1884375 RepID=UPI00089CDB2E|nr:sensor histidine kinase [Paenibacillus sp. PDC88]SDX80210.1 two-component system, sensor histidine kinase YesM [Paenibacillus sp. PDC88]
MVHILSSLSINKRLIAISLIFVCLPVIILGSYWYNASTRTIEESAIASNERIVTQTSEYLNLYISNLETSTYPFLSNPHIQTLINRSSMTPYEYLKLSDAIEKGLFAQMLYGRDDLVGLSVLAKNGMQVSDYSRSEEMLDMRSIRQRNRLLLADMDQMDDFHMTGIRYIGSEPVLTLIRKIPSSKSYLYEGLLVVDLNLDQIAGICSNVSREDLHLWIADTQNNRILYHPDKERINDLLPASLAEKFSAEPAGLIHEYEGNSENILLYEEATLSKWAVALEQPKNAIVFELLNLRSTTVYLFVVIMLVTLLVMGGFSLQISRALSLLQHFMKRIQSGDFSTPITRMTGRKDEIGGLFRSYSHMVGELKRLVSEVQSAKLKERELSLKQKESALHAMQSQINPHFLYNTLEVINAHAILDNQMVISRMTTSLADLFRYNLKNAHQIVTLREEIGHLRAYLDIQKARYRKLTVDICIEESVMDQIPLVRLTLQPLVENAFIHGYQHHRLPPSYIGLTGTVDTDGNYILRITDHGKGMEENRMEMLNQYFLNGEESRVEWEPLQSSGIGLTSVHERLRLSFECDYGLTIHSSGPAGTVIEIKLPLHLQTARP